jgi:hypothetical protein
MMKGIMAKRERNRIEMEFLGRDLQWWDMKEEWWSA